MSGQLERTWPWHLIRRQFQPSKTHPGRGRCPPVFVFGIVGIPQTSLCAFFFHHDAKMSVGGSPEGAPVAGIDRQSTDYIQCAEGRFAACRGTIIGIIRGGAVRRDLAGPLLQLLCWIHAMFLKLVRFAFSLIVAHIALRRRRLFEGGLLPSNSCYDDATALLCGGLRFAKSTSSINDICSVRRLVPAGTDKEALVYPCMLVTKF